MLEIAKPEPIRAPALDELGSAGIRHGYFTRVGGVSEGIYQSLNIGTGSRDDPDKVRENRRRVARWMGVAPDLLVTAYQIHSPDVLVVRGALEGERPRADALVTDTPGVALGISTADCGPV